MRCTRCDRPVTPQAVGRAPDGRLVFGWCLDCMEERRCARIRVARRGRLFRRRQVRRARPPLGLEERRALGLALVALPLVLWGVSLLAVGTWKALHPTRAAPNPFGPGTPMLLVVGGAALAVAGLVLAGVALARVPWFWRGLEWLLFGCAVLVLALGVVQYNPRRAPWMVALSGFAIALSGLIHQCRRFDLRPARPGSPHRPPGDNGDDAL